MRRGGSKLIHYIQAEKVWKQARLIFSNEHLASNQIREAAPGHKLKYIKFIISLNL
jgi:hypothetical protein